MTEQGAIEHVSPLAGTILEKKNLNSDLDLDASGIRYDLYSCSND